MYLLIKFCAIIAKPFHIYKLRDNLFGYNSKNINIGNKKLKSFIIIFILLSSSVYADSKLYLGLGYSNVNEKYDTLDAESSSKALQVKVGYGLREAYAIEVSVESLKNKSNVFSNNDGDKTSVDIEVVKSFDLGIYILPYFKAGFGAGEMKINREIQDKLNFGSFNLGAGTLIPIDEHFDFELGYRYKSISYEALDTISDRIEYKSKSNTLYIGFNARF